MKHQQNQKNWTQQNVYCYVEKRTEPLWSNVPYALGKKWKRQQLEKLMFLTEIPWRFLNFSYVFKWALKVLWLANTQCRYSRLYDASLSCRWGLWSCNDIVCTVGGGYFLKKVVPNSDKLTVLGKHFKIFIKDSIIKEFIYKGVQSPRLHKCRQLFIFK